MRTIYIFAYSITQKFDTYLLESINEINPFPCPTLITKEKFITIQFNW